MIDNLEYFSAKTLRKTGDPQKPIQGTGTIIASQGKYYLVTALHCMRQTDDKGNEILPPDWKQMSATVYLPDGEQNLAFKGIVDVDASDDWAILEIEKPDIAFNYETNICLTSKFDKKDEFGSFGFPKHIDDGMYLYFTPTNSRGQKWQLRDVVEGGSVKAITVEKGCSGMGLFYQVNSKYYCLGIINKSVPDGAFNVMKLISIKLMAKYFPDIYDGESNPMVRPTEEELEKQVNAEAKQDYAEPSDNELAKQFLENMELMQFAEAHQAIKQLWQRYPNDEWTTLNYIKTTALVEPKQLEGLQETALHMEYSSPQTVVFSARVFANYGYPQTAVDIWYNNALRFNDNELDTMFYVELLESPMKEIVYKEYPEVTEGKCVLYDDGHQHRHCVIAGNKTLLAKTMLGKKKDEEFELDIAGEIRKVRVVAIFDKYYQIVHRGLTDVMEQGGNNVMRPIRVNAQMTGEEALAAVFEAAGIDPTVNQDEQIQASYNQQPSLIINCKQDDLLWSYYRLLFSDFKLKPWPDNLKDPRRFNYIKLQTPIVIDLSSLLVLFEKTVSGEWEPNRKFIVSNFIYEYIKSYPHRSELFHSYDMFKVMEAGKIHKFSENGAEDLKLRYEALVKWMDDYCIKASSQLVLQLVNPMQKDDNDASRLMKNTIALFVEDPSRALLTEDWYYLVLFNTKFLMLNSEEYFDII